MSSIVSLFATFLMALSAQAVQAQEPEHTVNMSIFWLDGDIEPTSGWHGWTLTRCGVGENLLQIDEHLAYKPVLAESWKRVDALTTRFTLRDGVTFQSGRKADAAAVKASIERALRLTDRQDVQIPLERIEAHGNTLTIKTSRPFATLLNVLADPVFVIVDTKAAEANPDGFKFRPVTTGPFKVAQFSPQTGLVLTKHAGHWAGEPKVDKINVKYLPDASARAMALQSGELDFAAQLSAADLSVLQQDDNLKVLTGPNLRVFFVRTNFDHPWMQSAKFRQAIHHAIQKDVYAEKIAHGIPARGPFNDLLPFGHQGDDVYGYNKARARQLLDEAGFVDTDGDGLREYNGQKIVLQYVSMTNHGAPARNIGIAMQSELKKVGLALEVRQLENFAEAAKQGQFDFLYERWTSAPTLDPQYFLESSFKTGARGNHGHYANPKLDALLDELTLVQDPDRRHALGAQGAQMVMDDVAGIFLFYQRGNVVHSKRVSGVHKFISEIYYIDERLTHADQ